MQQCLFLSKIPLSLYRAAMWTNVNEYTGSSESLYQCDEWTSKKGKREKKDKGYCYLHRLSSKEQLVHISVIFVIHFCSIGADIAALHLCSLSPQLVHANDDVHMIQIIL
ncbi:hypothetical protein T4A_7141 [Trichinella pseudospiralis]|uniref:Uncharacterized protein n=1 Tax=Trichinella pseudospiralis TaxID=6337 RepID=A0A0V1E125_TRIPS|nr:hypothetical protein T4A_7141 [Trichinella pseudospiralis]